MKLSSMGAPEIVMLTTSDAANDENFVKMTTFPFQCLRWHAMCGPLDPLLQTKINGNLRMDK